MSATFRRRIPHLFLLAGLAGLLTACALTAAPEADNAAPETRFMLADIPKPTYTPLPTSTPFPTSTPLPAAAPAGLIEVSIVDVPIQPSSADGTVNTTGKYILVDISDQQMYVYENGVLIYNFIVSTGIHNATRTGLFHVQSKIPNAYGATWNIWMPNWLGIYYAGGLENGIHSLPILPNGAELWAGYLGTPVSYGCVVLGSNESSILYDWAEIGVPVEIQW
ncbi:MAG: hypothetical protein JETCAE02_16310 [Anaerolineaceae bacterium]|jgi:lipoprotein-anchoring transpeptidase ErfK/SrfK|nr:murein L,D-transpeptidase [Anaerolineae bacterium]MBV6466676.1 hypothetical protein [Anaerolineales bacterium]MCE7905421.1 murein L,D-transpeptidase [Anaerolineae bacterium CFX3]MDL1925167.1 L,D-transpeptidase [Anaerolineae bacterium AMX1]GER79028.1 conserved hypothetical protein [Candidatus Denitrolinea symbiosum]GIK08897.1 MAG: hypothetical protein BroJett001_09630 [Chloroflexota bacterium]GJQ39219.1 MAG: hypothetical protein JETCAE02_16310 [Anaerolineaceae bacterium]